MMLLTTVFNLPGIAVLHNFLRILHSRIFRDVDGGGNLLVVQ
jgi:hypothetical protein